ncbi:hypothetical protein [Arcticibacterium luteifluviistationis]|uniref:Uncharacterized protein n=1 Tax=Arcticibacterium luteifluviistationis TaxID=1784714 RepID=A0A2Z4GFG2_9BACT|nr:hypothetical protein [Arcticibacterium luteifluviistationis]AWV99797.1 hypothetical protein DJ013_17100 [Arcticibacterium luteifluviistationis]
MIEFKDRFQNLNTTIRPLIHDYFIENDGEKGDFINELSIEELLTLRESLLDYGGLLNEWIDENKENWNDDLHNSFRFLDLCVNAKIQLEKMHHDLSVRHKDYLEYLKKNNLVKFDFK